MKRHKKILIMGGILIALCAAALIISGVEKTQDKIKNTDAVVVSFNTDDVTSIDWNYGVSEYSFTREDGQWYWDEDKDLPLENDFFDELSKTLSSYQASFVIESYDNLSDYGLKSPTATVNVHTADKDYTINFGSYSTMDEERYFMTDDGNVYLASKDITDDLLLDIIDNVKNDEVPDLDKIKTIKISGTAELEIVYEKDAGYCYSDEFTYYVKDGSGYKALDTDAVEDIIDSAEGLTLNDFATYTASADDISQYDMENPPLSVCFEYEDGNETKNCTLYTSLVGEDDDAICYVRLDDSEFIYGVDTSWYDLISDACYDNLKPKNPLTLDWTKLSLLTVSAESESADIVYDKKEDELKLTEQKNDEDVIFDGLKAALSKLSVSEFTDDKSVARKELSLTVKFDSEEYPQLLLVFYRYDGESCLMYVDGKPYGLVSRSSIIDIREMIYAEIL